MVGNLWSSDWSSLMAPEVVRSESTRLLHFQIAVIRSTLGVQEFTMALIDIESERIATVTACANRSSPVCGIVCFMSSANRSSICWIICFASCAVRSLSVCGIV